MWHPDGKHLVFGTTAHPRIYWARADGSGDAALLLEVPGGPVVLPDSFTPDGSTLLFSTTGRDTGSRIWTAKLDLTDPDHPKAGEPRPVFQIPEQGTDGVISPDGRWLAYLAPRSSGQRAEIYVQPFPPIGAKWKISKGVGPQLALAWARDTHDLFYLGPGARIMVASYRVKGGSFEADRARVWSKTRIEASYPRAFDISPDGKRAVVCLPAEPEGQSAAQMTYIVNFFDELRRGAR